MHHIIIIYSMKNGLSFWDLFMRKDLAVLLNYCFLNINRLLAGKSNSNIKTGNISVYN